MATTWAVEKYMATLLNETFSNGLNWTVVAGSTYINIVTGSPNYLRLGDNSGNDSIGIVHNTLLPYDSTKLYKMIIDVKEPTGSDYFFAGWVGYASNGSTYVDSLGNNTLSGQYYHATGYNQTPSSSSWTTYTGYTQGLSSPGMDGGTNISNPGSLHANVAYIRPHIIAHQQGLAGITDVKSVLIETVGAPAPVSDGTILSPRGQSYSEISASTIQQLDLADGSKGIVTPETKYSNASMKFFWHKADVALKTKLEGYINTGTGVRLTTHISGKRYTGYFTNIESELIIGQKTEQYNITAEFLPFTL